MLRIFHTADWHLGQTFHDYERTFEHQCFLDWLVERITERKPDVLLLSGDVFDSINPPASAQRQYFHFLRAAISAHPSLQIVITAGNHDAAARLEAPAPVLGNLRVHVVGTVERDRAGGISYSKFVIPLGDGSGTVRALALAIPFLRIHDLPYLPHADDMQDPYTAGIRAFYAQATDYAAQMRDARYPGAALIALGHCHMQEGAVSGESERRLVVGGLESLRADAFPAQISYVALGHLHKPQALDGGRIRYSGSPLPLSFSEREYPHQIVEIELGSAGAISARPLEIPRAVSLQRLPRGSVVPLPELVQILQNERFDPGLPPERHPFLEVRYLDDGPNPTRRHQVEKALEGKPVRLASTKFERLHSAESSGGTDPLEGLAGLGDLRSVDPVAVFQAAFLENHQRDADPEILSVFKEILAEVHR
jgi:exonuclease SbcD